MAYQFKRITYPLPKRLSPEQRLAAEATLKKLKSFVDKESADLVYVLMNLHRAQGKAITYKELRESILAGAIDESIMDDWRQDYVKFVADHLAPKWEKAMDAATKAIREKYPEWYFDPMGDGVRLWTSQRSAEFVTSVTSNQMEGLRAIIRRAAVLEDINVDLLARAVRGCVGLYHQQAVSNMRYFETLIKGGTSEQRALDLSIRYGARQSNYRSYLIARTELNMAYSHGAYEGTKQAQAAGYMGKTVKIWCTADTDRTCDRCRSLDGKIIGMDESFYSEIKDRSGAIIRERINPRLSDSTMGLTPPAHPNCMCSILFEEIEPPIGY